MNMVPVSKNEIMNLGGYSKTKNLEFLEEFVRSDLDCVRVEGWTHASADGCAASFNSSIKNYRMNSLKAIVRNREVYLIKKNKFKE